MLYRCHIYLLPIQQLLDEIKLFQTGRAVDGDLYHFAAVCDLGVALINDIDVEQGGFEGTIVTLVQIVMFSSSLDSVGTVLELHDRLIIVVIVEPLWHDITTLITLF